MSEAYTEGVTLTAMNRTFTILIGIIFLIGVAGFLYFLTPNSSSVEERADNQIAYENTDHGFSLSYPASLDILEYTDDMASIGTLIEGGIRGDVDVRVQIIEANAGESFADAAARDLANLCAADGPDESFSCTGVDSVRPFAADSGEPGFELYLKGENMTLSTQAKESVRKGPYYVFALSTGATATKVLIVHAPLNLSSEEADSALIESIAKSVRIAE